MRSVAPTSAFAIATAAVLCMWPAVALTSPDTPDADQAGPSKPNSATPVSMMNLTPPKALVRPYPVFRTEPKPDRVPTSVNYKPFARGPVGSVGLVRMTASHALDSSALGNASAGQPGAPSETVGANLLYAFH